MSSLSGRGEAARPSGKLAIGLVSRKKSALMGSFYKESQEFLDSLVSPAQHHPSDGLSRKQGGHRLV